MSKQDRQGVRTPADLERKYKLGETLTATGNQAEQISQMSQTLSQFMTETNEKLSQWNENGNAEIKATASGSVVHIDGLTPEATTIAKISGADDPTAVTVIKCGKNLLNKDDYKVCAGYPHETTGVIAASSAAKTLYIRCYPKTTYTVSKMESKRFAVAFTTEPVAKGVSFTDMQRNDTGTALTATSSRNARYLIVWYYNSNYDTDVTADDILSTIQIEIGDTATEYEAYSTTTYTPNADGTCEIVPELSAMALSTDTTGVTIELEYSQDIQTAVEYAKNGISQLDEAITELSEEAENAAEDETDILKLNDLKALENKMANINQPFGSDGAGGAEPLVLLHFSDIHGDSDNLQRIKVFYDYFVDEDKGYKYIDDVIHTGDSVNGDFADTFAFWKTNEANSFLNMLGNHDAGWSDEDPTLIEQEDCYAKFIEPFVDEWGLDSEQLEEIKANNRCYYYKDYKYTKTEGTLVGKEYGYRLIVLDACHYNDDQNNWLVSVLQDVLDNPLAKAKDTHPDHYLHVIVANHFGTYDKVGLQSSFCSLEMAETVYEVEENEYAYYLDPRALDAIDTFINNGGTFACHLCGHTHRDELSYNSAYPNQLFIAVNTAGIRKSGHDFARKSGIKSQDLFNIIGFDYDQRRIKAFRVGADYDVNMRNVDSFCYDYKNNSMIYTGEGTSQDYVDGQIGNIETALDSIIAIQNSLIGGDVE